MYVNAVRATDVPEPQGIAAAALVAAAALNARRRLRLVAVADMHRGAHVAGVFPQRHVRSFFADVYGLLNIAAFELSKHSSQINLRHKSRTANAFGRGTRQWNQQRARCAGD
jgi:hypothetical protein